jgi:ATP-binding cassette subfamily B protein
LSWQDTLRALASKARRATRPAARKARPAAPSDGAPQLRLRSAISGRERWEVDALRHRADLARAFEERALAQPGITGVHANPATGRVLLQFAPASLAQDTRSLIAGILTAILIDIRRDTPVVARHAGRPARGSEPGQRPAGHVSLSRLVARTAPSSGLVIAASVVTGLRVVVSFLPALSLSDILALVRGHGTLPIAGSAAERARVEVVALGIRSGVAIVFDVLFEHVERKLRHELAQAVEHELRRKVFTHVQTLDMAYIDEQSTSKLLNLVASDTAAIGRFLEHGAGELIQKSVTWVASGALLFALSPTLGLVASVPLVLMLMVSKYFQGPQAERHQAIGQQSDELDLLLSNNLSGLPTVRSFAAEDDEIERVEHASLALGARRDEAFTVGSINMATIRLLLGASYTSAFVLSALLALRGALSLRAFTAMTFLLTRMVKAPINLRDAVDEYHAASAAAARILDLLATEPTITAGGRALATRDVRGAIELEGVVFGYDPAHPVLHGLDMSIAAHDHVAIVGPTGAGKSTLVKLLLRFYDVTGGTIRIDGQDIRELELRDLRRAIGYVSQDVYLFHGTVYENIVFGNPRASRDEVEQAARSAEAYEFIQALPDGFDTLVGERGQKLSTGQRQRLSIARAMLSNPPILVLDEATSAVDNETEAAIQRSIESLARGRTILSIAHRLSTVRKADRIFVLGDGRIQEHGDHDQLVRAGGTYASYWQLQSPDPDPGTHEG